MQAGKKEGELEREIDLLVYEVYKLYNLPRWFLP
jgi:hypothetical protein